MKKRLLFVAMLCFFLAGILGFIIADPIPADEEAPAIEAVDTVEVVPPAEDIADESTSIGKNVWVFLNSPLGVSIVAFILTTVLGKIFTAKPKWKALVLKYGPSIMRAIKVAEKKIPDNTTNAGLARLDEAMRYLIGLEPKLKSLAEDDLKTAISAVHSTAEAGGNLKKE